MADKDERNNGILGLDRAPVPKAPGDPAASDDAASTHQRHRRIVNAEEEAFAETHEDTPVSGPAPRVSTWDRADKAHISAENR